MNRDSMMKKLHMLDFMAADLHLYLNTHPTDKAAIAEYNKVNEMASAIREDYEKLYGPLCSYRSASDENHWSWLSEHCPWDSEYNINMNEGGRN